MPLIASLGVMNAINFGLQGTIKQQFIIAASNTAPYTNAYKVSSDGFGTKYANPATDLTWGAAGIDINSTNTAIVIGYGVFSPYINAYKWSNGFGTLYSNPATLPPDITDIKFNQSGNVVIGSSGTSPYCVAYNWNDTSGFGTKYANPSTALSAYIASVSINKLTNDVAFAGGASSPYISVYAWSSGFGTKYANPATQSPRNSDSVSFSPSGSSLSMALSSANNAGGNIFTYAWSSGFGTIYTNPGTGMPTTSVKRVLFNNTGTTLIFNLASSTKSFVWSDASGYGTLFNAIPTSGFSITGTYQPAINSSSVFYAGIGSPFIGGNPYSNSSGFGTAYTSPLSTMPGISSAGITCSK